MGLQALNAPTRPTDLARLQDARGAQQLVMPRIGWNQSAMGWFTTATGTPVRQVVYFAPFIVGPQGWTTDQAQMAVTTAAVGGSAPLLDVAIYGDDGTGWPDVVTGPLCSATFSTLTSTGNKTVAWSGGAKALAPGLYWLAVRYDYTTIPTTAPVFSTYTNVTWSLPQATGLGFTQTRGYKTVATNIASMPSGTALDSTTMTITGSTDNPVVGVHRSA
jgi:hypothetical protein